MNISAIVAVSSNGIIGQNGQIPWKIPLDLQRFRDYTIGHPVIMGRRTWDSIGKPLTDRTNIVLSRQPRFKIAGCKVACTTQQALGIALKSPGNDEIFVIGGATIYRQFAEKINRIYFTRILEKFEGDVEWPPDYVWSGNWRRKVVVNESDHDFFILEREKR